MSILIKGIDMPPRRNCIRGYYIDGDGSVTNLSRTKVVGEAVQYIEPERKKGKWIPIEESGGGYWQCNCCGFPSEAFAADVLYHFCPKCGADMRGEQHD